MEPRLPSAQPPLPDAPQAGGDRHRPLRVHLLALTLVTGVVDAISYVALGHVFVANMTGNIVFLGFAAADPQSFSVPASLTAIVAFLAGALAGGRRGVAMGLASRPPADGGDRHRIRLFAAALAAALFAPDPGRARRATR